jgi:perosamine synthetase
MSVRITQSILKRFIDFTRNIYGKEYIPLHRPIFNGNEKKYLNECIDSNFVSSVGAKVVEFENLIAEYTGSKYAIATVNGTAALHISLHLSGVRRDDEVITQALTFVGTCNPIVYIGAHPVFVDVDLDTMGMSPESLRKFLIQHAILRDGNAWNKSSGRRIAACVPMHTFGMPCRVDQIALICKEWGISLVEDAAESLGSYVGDRHTATFGICGTLSFNGNKIITTGGGGMIITNNYELANKAKHITTTSKIPHPYEFVHDEIGYNYRLPNINAALGCAQMELLTDMLKIKKNIFLSYAKIFEEFDIQVLSPLESNSANHWLNAIVLHDKSDRDLFLKYTNDNGVMTRPIWRLMSELSMFKSCQKDDLKNSIWLEERVVNIPSSVPDISTDE